MLDEGWFWLIPLNKTKTSVGLVIDPDIARGVMKQHNLSADQMLALGDRPLPASPASE